MANLVYDVKYPQYYYYWLRLTGPRICIAYCQHPWLQQDFPDLSDLDEDDRRELMEFLEQNRIDYWIEIMTKDQPDDDDDDVA
jgi:hypothetical protein